MMGLDFPRTKGLFAGDKLWTFSELEYVCAKRLGSQWHRLNTHWSCCGIEGKPGTYVIMQGGRVLYVGMTMNLAKRFERHEVLGKIAGDGVIVKVRHGDIRTGDFLAREYRLIRRFNPPLNQRYRVIED